MGSSRRNLDQTVNGGGDMLIQLIQPIIARHSVRPGQDPAYPQGWTCHVKGVHSSGQKETRIIDRLEPVMNQHRLIVDRSVASDTVLMRQLTRITRERSCLEHDDRLEALSGVVAEWQDVLHVDADLQAQRKKDRDFEEYQRKVRSRLAPKRPTWIRH